MKLDRKGIGFKQNGLINYLKKNKSQSIKKKIVVYGTVIFLSFNITNFVINPYKYYEFFTNQTESQIISEKDYKIIAPFCELFENLPNNWQQNFNNNFEKLKIYNVPTDIITIINDSAGYYMGDSRIVVKKEYNHLQKTVLSHELLHMASDNGKNSGLRVNHQYCRGLNEGYTNHLSKSLFGYKSDAYEPLSICAEIFDSIIGTEKMMDYYFTSNGEGLINEISCIYKNADNIIYGKYDEKECKEKTLQLMRLIDKLSSLSSMEEATKLTDELTNKLYELAVYSKLCMNNIHFDDNLDIFYNVYFDRELIDSLETLSLIEKSCMSFERDFNNNHPVNIKTLLSGVPLKTPNEIIEKNNKNIYIR